jgi:hypothetical protein
MNRVLVFITILIFITSCREVIVEFESPNDYFIENESSKELYYYNSIDSTEIFIPIDSNKVIEETGPWGNISIDGNEFFKSIKESEDKDMFLYRDSSGIKIPTFQLNSIEDLNWEEEIISETKNSTSAQHVLLITDDMLF